MTAKPALMNRGVYPIWTEAEDGRLLKACQGKASLGVEAWKRLAEDFPGRSFYAVRQRYLVLRNRAAGVPPRKRVQASKADATLVRSPVKSVARPEPPPPVEYKTLTAAFFRDPPPGRSALDKQRAGIVDDLPPSNHREVYYASRPKITLAGGTME